MLRGKEVTMVLAVVILGLSIAPPLAAQQASDSPLPIQRVVLYKSGIGYFEHVGEVNGDDEVTISFTSAQLDDVLKTLTVLDLDGGQVPAINYNSLAPIGQRLRTIRLPVGATPSFFEVLSALRGARVEVRAGGETVAGRVLSAERQERRVGEATTTTEEVSIVTDDGDLRRFELGPQVSVRLLDADLRQEMARYLGLLESTRNEDVRRLTIPTQGSGERSLFVSYVSEVPIWKTSYRIVMPSTPEGSPILQGWAIVDNTVGEDWNDVELSLVGGSPQSFIQQISQPYYARRPVVPMPDYAQSSPQTHGATLSEGSGRIVGVVRDEDGAPLPGVAVVAAGNEGATGGAGDTTYSGVDGTFGLGPLPAGNYTVAFSLDGFRSRSGPTRVSGGNETRYDVTMRLGTIEETITVTGESPVVDARPRPQAESPEARAGAIAAAGSWTALDSAGGADSEPIPLEERIARGLESLEAVAQAEELGDLFEYRISERVTIPRGRSAMVNVLQAEIEAEKVSLWSGGARSGKPLRALWLTNGAAVPLDGGSFTLVEDSAFAGEGLLDSIQPGERRLLSYGTDEAMLVDGQVDGERGTVRRVWIANGALIYESDRRERRTYTVRNQSDETRDLIIEHPSRDGWEIVSEALPEETAPGVHRFRVEVGAQQTAALEVAESRPLETRVSLSNVTDDHIAMLVAEGISRDSLETALRPVLDMRARIGTLRGEISARRQEANRIDADQNRLRENIQALGDSAEERALVARYVRRLDEQEDRLEALRAEIADREATLETLTQELLDLMEAASEEIESGR